MKKATIITGLALCAALLFTSCKGLLTAQMRAEYKGLKLPGEGYEVGDLIYDDGSATSYTTVIEEDLNSSSSYFNPPCGLVLRVDDGVPFCMVISTGIYSTVYFPKAGATPTNWKDTAYSTTNDKVAIMTDHESKTYKDYQMRLPTMEELRLISEKSDMVNAVLERFQGIISYPSLAEFGGNSYTNSQGVFYSSEKADTTPVTYDNKTYGVYKAYNFGDRDNSETICIDCDNSISLIDDNQEAITTPYNGNIIAVVTLD